MTPTTVRLLKAIPASILVYLLADAGLGAALELVGLGYLHAFLAMLCGMLVGGFLATRNFIWIAVTLNLAFSTLTYVVVARMREQPVFELIQEQHLMVSVGSFAGAILGAWLGQTIAMRKRGDAGTAGQKY